MKDTTREAWLNRAVKELRTLFTRHGYTVPRKIRASAGFPYRGGRKAMGQAWPVKSSADGHSEMFVSPAVADSGRVLSILVHEVAHAIVGTKEGHGPKFGKCARAVGLEGKLTATKAGCQLTVYLLKIADKLGPYPHASLTPGDTMKKQGTRMLRLRCDNCGCVIRTTQKWLDMYTLWICPCGGDMTLEDK